jgi:hypothetical protein
VGDDTRQGSTSVSTSPSGWNITTNANGWDAQPESVYLLSAVLGQSGTVAWQPPNASALPADGFAGVMLRAGNDPTAGAPFVFVGVRQGSPGVELAWRSYPGQTVQTATGILSATDFPDGSKLRLEWVQGRAFLSYQQGGVTNPPWRRRLAIELTVSTETSPVVGGLAFGSDSATGVAAAFTVAATDIAYSEKEEGARWMRVVEPFEDLGLNGAQGDRLSMQGYGFYSGVDFYPYTGIDVTKVTGSTAAAASGGDFWRVELSGAEPYAMEEFAFYGVPSPTADVVDVYVRLGEVTAQTAIPLMDLSRAGGSPPVESSLSSAPIGHGVWEFVGQFPASTSTEATSHISFILTWEMETGLKDQFAFDGWLLAGQTHHADQNGDGLPDQVWGVDSFPLTYTGDYDGDGWLNGEEFVLGTDPRSGPAGTVTLTKQAPLDSPWDLARGMWSLSPATVKATYVNPRPGRSEVVEGFPIRFDHSSSATGRIGFGFLGAPAPLMDGGYVTLTDAQGMGRSHLWIDETCPLLSGGATYPVTVDGLTSGSTTNQVTYALRPYDNSPPEPVDLLGVENSLTYVDALTGISSTPLLVGEWLLIGEPSVPAEGAGSNQTGRVALRRWSGVERAWLPAGFLPQPAGLTGNAFFGQSMVHDGNLVVITGGGKIHTYVLSEDGQTWQPWGTPVTITGGVLKARNDWLAVRNYSDRGAVSLYKRGSTSWAFVTTLLPAGDGHSDKFGESAAFSADGARLVVGAPSDPGWFINPANAPYEGYVWTEWEVNDPIWDWVYDEYGNPTWSIVGYNTYITGDYVLTNLSPPAASLPSVYVYELTGSSTWTQSVRIINPDGMPSPVALMPPPQPGEATPSHFGASVVDIGGCILVGSPQYSGAPDGFNQVQGIAGSIIAYRKNSSTQVWYQAHRYDRANPRFGWNLLAQGENAFAGAPSFVDHLAQPQAGFVDLLAVTSSTVSHLQDLLMPETAAVVPVVADALSVWIRRYTTSQSLTFEEYQWLPTVGWDDEEETTIAGWLTAFDYNLFSGVPASETVGLSLIEASPRWELTSPALGETAPTVGTGQTSPLAVRLKEGAGLASLAPAIDWLGVASTDRAGQTYQEFHGIRIRGQIPTAPEIESTMVIGRQALAIGWEQPLHQPEVIVVEKASAGAVEDWQTAQGTSQELDELFSEAGRLSAAYTSFIHSWTGTYGNTVFRLRAANSEGVSAPGDYVVIDLDSDNDGLPDWWEDLYGNLSPSADADGDGLSNLNEYVKGTNPLVGDTDGDGRLDGTDATPLEFNSGSVNFVIHTVLE